MKYKVEVNTAGDPQDAWTSNALTFDTIDEAENYARDLTARWTAVKDWRVVDTTDGEVKKCTRWAYD